MDPKSNVIDFIRRQKERPEHTEHALVLGKILYGAALDAGSWYNDVYQMWSGEEVVYEGDISDHELADHLEYALRRAFLARFDPACKGELDFSPPVPDLLQRGLFGEVPYADSDFVEGVVLGLLIARDRHRQNPEETKRSRYKERLIDGAFDNYVLDREEDY